MKQAKTIRKLEFEYIKVEKPLNKKVDVFWPEYISWPDGKIWSFSGRDRYWNLKHYCNV